MGICQCKGSMKGKVVVITGGNKGIGFETSVDLAKRGAQLVIGCRKTHHVMNKIESRVPGSKADVISLDLSSRKSIYDFAENVKSNYGAIDVLINNAGMINVDYGPEKRHETVDGIEVVMATNHLGHALLNHLLLDLVKKAGEADNFSRIILVSSMEVAAPEARDLYSKEKVNFDVPEKLKDARYQYSKSKLAQVMYGNHLARILKDEGCNTTVATLHPGIIYTDLFNGYPKMVKAFVKIFCHIAGKNTLQGAQTTIHLAVAKFSNPTSDVSGRFFADCKSNSWVSSWVPKLCKNPIACQKVYEETIKVLDL